MRLRPLTWYIDKRCHGVRARESFDERSFDHFQSTTMVRREAPELMESWVMRPGWRAMAVGSCLCKALLWWAGRLEDRLNKPKKNIKRQTGVREKMNSPWSPREITEVMTQQSGFKRSCYSKKGNFVQLFFLWKRGWRDQYQLNHHCQIKDKSFIRKHFFACPFDTEEYIWCKDLWLYQNCNMLK